MGATVGAIGICERVLLPDNMHRAWEHVRDSDMADGVLSRGVEILRDNLPTRLEELSIALRSGTYQPGMLFGVDVAKRSGGVRRLRVPSAEDRVVERAVAQVLSHELDWCFSPFSFAYRPSLGVDDAVHALAELRDDGLVWVVRADVRDAFDSIDASRLRQVLHDALEDEWLDRLVQKLLARRAWLAGSRRVLAAGGAAQGSPLSPLLCNLYLDQVDRAMARRGVSLVRFADDMAIPAASESEARDSLAALADELRTVGMRLAEEKTEVVAFAEGFVFLGMEFAGSDPDISWIPADPVAEKRTLFVGLQGAYLGMKEGQVRVGKGGDQLLSIPVTHVARIVMCGAVGLSAPLRSYALYQGIDVVFLSRRGRWLGRLDAGSTGQRSLRRAQERLARAGSFRLEISKAFVAGKIANQRALLLRRARGRNGAALADMVDRLGGYRQQAVKAKEVAELRGIEGAAGREYFRALKLVLGSAGVSFGGRNRRPPLDGVNSALGLGYALLLGEVVGGICAAGLDPGAGFLHAEAYGRPSLALDVMEELRPVVVDSVVVEAYCRRSLLPDQVRPAGGTGKGVYLTDKARNRLFGLLEERLLTRFAHVPSGTRTSYRRAIHLQAFQVASCIRRGVADYRPVSWR